MASTYPLPTKAERQIAKLELTQTKRQLVGTAGYRELRYYDANLLPARYQENDTVLTPHPDGLQQGRPWKSTPNILAGLWRSQYNGYFDGDWTWFDTQTPTESIQVTDFSIPADIPSTSFQWLGYFQAPHTANYTFYVYSDDESYFWIGNNAITDYTDANATMYSNCSSVTSAPVALTAGEYYPIRLQYGNTITISTLDISWSDDYTPPGP